MRIRTVLLAVGLLLSWGTAPADEVQDFSATINAFKEIPGVKPYFDPAYGYAVWDTIAKGGLGIGAATGKGLGQRIYRP